MAVRSWISSSLVRHFPSTPVPRGKPCALEAALNETVSFQVGMRLTDEERLNVRIEVSAPAGLSARVRRVGYVPVRHHNQPIPKNAADVDGRGHLPGYVPDPLYDENTYLLPPAETHAFWITVKPGRNVRPGAHTIKVRVVPEKGKHTTHSVRLRLHDVALAKRKDFSITHWFYADSLIDWYSTDLFDRRFWQIVPAYMRNMVEHGQDTVYVPVFTPPLDGVKRPSQLLRVSKKGEDRYRFNWRDVKTYVQTAKLCGLQRFEWCHPFTQWGVENAIRIYEGQGKGEKLLWPPKTGATSKTYRAFLDQYLPALHRFLSEEKILDKSFFHVSDEPHGEKHIQNYRRARSLLMVLAPWMKVMDALTEIEFARQGLTDMPIPSIKTALQFVKEGIPSWCYYCCGPRDRYLNRLMDTPLPKIAMHGFLFYRWPFQGFLHWGYNYWYKSQTRDLVNPFVEQAGCRWQKGWAYGDTFVVYPGPRGPIDSIRWEVFGESLQDYRLLQTLGVDRDDKLFTPIKSFADFPKTEKWRQTARAKLFSRA